MSNPTFTLVLGGTTAEHTTYATGRVATAKAEGARVLHVQAPPTGAVATLWDGDTAESCLDGLADITDYLKYTASARMRGLETAPLFVVIDDYAFAASVAPSARCGLDFQLAVGELVRLTAPADAPVNVLVTTGHLTDWLAYPIRVAHPGLVELAQPAHDFAVTVSLGGDGEVNGWTRNPTFARA